MMDHATEFPLKVEIPCLEKYMYHAEPTGSLNYQHHMQMHKEMHKIKSSYESVASGTDARG